MPRGLVLRCHIEDDENGEAVIYIDDGAFDLAEFGALLRYFCRVGHADYLRARRPGHGAARDRGARAGGRGGLGTQQRRPRQVSNWNHYPWASLDPFLQSDRGPEHDHPARGDWPLLTGLRIAAHTFRLSAHGEGAERRQLHRLPGRVNPVNLTKTAQLHNPLGRHPEGQDLSTDRPGCRSGQRSTSVEITQQPRNPRETLARHGENEAGAFRAAGTRARGRLSPPRMEPANDPFEDGGDQNGDRCNSDPASGRLHVRRSWGEADGRPEGLTASPGQAHGGACRQTGGA